MKRVIGRLIWLSAGVLLVAAGKNFCDPNSTVYGIGFLLAAFIVILIEMVVVKSFSDGTEDTEIDDSEYYARDRSYVCEPSLANPKRREIMESFRTPAQTPRPVSFADEQLLPIDHDDRFAAMRKLQKSDDPKIAGIARSRAPYDLYSSHPETVGEVAEKYRLTIEAIFEFDNKMREAVKEQKEAARRQITEA